MLYVGLGLVALGVVTMVVGVGEKGFQTVGLRLLGPGVACCGAILVASKILSCFVRGMARGKNGRPKGQNDKDTESYKGEKEEERNCQVEVDKRVEDEGENQQHLEVEREGIIKLKMEGKAREENSENKRRLFEKDRERGREEKR